MMTTTATTITIVKATLFAAVTVLFGIRTTLILVLALAFWAGTELRSTVATAIVAAITAATASTTTASAMILTTTVSTAIAAFVTATFAAGTFVLTSGWGSCGFLGRIAAEETLQPTEEARFFGFGDGGRGLRFKRARLATIAELFFAWFTGLILACAEWFAAFAERFTTRFARAKLVARFLWLFAAGRTFI